MSTTASYASEALVGPPSQPINIREFFNRCSHSPSSADQGSGRANSTFDLSENHAVKEECSVADLQASLNETLSNPFKYSFLVRSHENHIESIRAAALKSTGQASKPSRSKKRKRPADSSNFSDDSHLDPEVLRLRNNLENIALSCWSYPTDAALFTRPQKNSDLNILTKPRRSRSSEEQQQQRTSSPLPTVGEQEQQEPDAEAVLVISIYNRLSWGNHLSRSSQHAALASQTIGELYDVIPCSSNEIPCEVMGDEDGEFRGYSSDELTPPPHRGAVVCIEGVAYGDGQAEEDYSDKLIQQIELLPEKKRPQTPITKGACMYDQRFVDMTMRLNQAYWLLHQGTCEHFMIIDTIRMLHPEDPKDGYPLTLHIAPPIVDLCMACSRVPAGLSVVGDVRLGQSPFKICKPCWTLFGEPSAQEKVEAAPLPKYEHGW